MSDLLKEEFLRRLNDAQDLGDWQQAENWARQWLQGSNKDPEAFRWLGRASLKLHKVDRAAYAYKRLLDYLPEDREARAFFVEYPSSTDKKAELEEVPKQQEPEVFDITPKEREDLAQLEHELGKKYYRLGQYALAADRFHQSFSWDGNEKAALSHATALHRARNSQAAVAFLRRQLLENGNWVQGKLLLGKILFELGQLGGAQKLWQEILRIDPSNQEALDSLRHCLS